MVKAKLFVGVCIFFFLTVHCDLQVGPDPWDLKSNEQLINANIKNEPDIPPDLRAIPKNKKTFGNGAGPSDWFYKRLLAIILKSGQVKKNEDGTVVVSLEMKFDEDRWQLLDGYTTLNLALTEDMIRRSMGYIENAIYKPTIAEKVVVAWREYIQLYLIEYKVPITWTLAVCATIVAAIWVWNHMSHKHIYIVLFIALYLYEVFTSYKEAEKEDLQRFLSAVNSCKWQIWSSHCDVPPPDPLIFIKYMNPLKIIIRMFATVITEPIISISETVKILISGITDGLWFPLNKILYGILILNYTILLILFLIMIVFNYILNIPFNFSLMGLLNIGIKQRNRSFNNSQIPTREEGDRITGATLDRLLDVCSRALSAQTAQNNNMAHISTIQFNKSRPTSGIRRSASTGRLPNSNILSSNVQLEDAPKLKNRGLKLKLNGGGDGVS